MLVKVAALVSALSCEQTAGPTSVLLLSVGMVAELISVQVLPSVDEYPVSVVPLTPILT
jgi:hypothetical protein